MHQPSVYFVGQPREVAHHAAPFEQALNVIIAEPASVLQQANAGDLAIFYSEHFDRFRDCCHQLKRRNVATLYLIDGILEWRNAWENRPDEVACPYAMRPVLAHKVACIGESQQRVLNAWGNVGKTEIVGIPRIDVLSKRQSARAGSEETFRVLIMTAKTPGFTSEQIQTTRQSLIDLKRWLAGHPTLDDRACQDEPGVTRKIEFIWRLTGNLASEIGVENSLSDLTGEELKAVLPGVDAVISTSSTAMLEAMQMGLPTALLDYHNCPHYVNAGWRIFSPEHIGQTLAQMLRPTPARLMFQQLQLEDTLYLESNASERFADLANLMLKLAGQQIASGQTNSPDALSFPANLLESPAPAVCEFNHSRVYENADEFLIDDKTALQVELSHSRREIAHLQRELTQLSSELDQAHQIFEQIQKHPVAGPIVRIRQKMLDLMAALQKRKNKLDSACPAIVSKPANSQPESRLNQ